MPVRQLTFDEFYDRLRPWGCERLNFYRSGLETWTTGWGTLFTVNSDDGTYDEWLYEELVNKVFPQTMPKDWSLPKNGVAIDENKSPSG